MARRKKSQIDAADSPTSFQQALRDIEATLDGSTLPGEAGSPNITCARQPEVHARHVLEAMSHLHLQGFGRLRLLCYIKEGLPAWRHLLFISDRFSRGDFATQLYSVPTNLISLKPDPESIAEEIKEVHHEIIEAARGPFDDYCSWIRQVLEKYPDEVFEMENEAEARIGSKSLRTPYSETLG